MFNDRFGLTKAVIEGRKTMTRRIVKGETPLGNWEETEKYAHYKVGEVIAIAQSYNDVIDEWKKGYIKGFYFSSLKDRAGMTNKMFVRSEKMPHHIKITNIRVERLQDISDEDCLREGVRLWEDADSEYKSNPLGKLYEIVGVWDGYKSPREAFAALIDKVSGKGTWESNPYVWVYEFELTD